MKLPIAIATAITRDWQHAAKEMEETTEDTRTIRW